MASGAFKWNFDVRHLGSEISSLVVANDKVVTSGRKEQQGKVALLSVRDGSNLWSLNLPAPPVHHGLAVGFGRLYISCSDGTLHCYGE